MPENADEITWSEAYLKKLGGAQPAWRIRHPEGRFYVGLIVASLGDPTPTRALGLVREAVDPPADAMQFGRRQDAERFAAAFLAPDIAWVFEPPAVPPSWFAAQPDHLLEALTHELASTTAVVIGGDVEP